MRARQRHLNKSLRETACAFDSRFITGLSDGSSVSTWSDLSANGRDVSQATAANQPTYKTAIQGGNPVVRFDGSNDQMETASTFASTSQVTAVFVAKANNWTSPGAYRSIGGHGYVSATSLTSGIVFGYLANGTLLDWQTGDFLAFGNGYNSGQNPRAIGPSASGSDFRVVSVVFWTSLARTYQNGVRVSTRVESTASINAFTRSFKLAVGNTAEVWSGDIAAFLYFGSNIGEPMRARLERSNALAFKIACS
jgi:hypothetical protein